MMNTPVFARAAALQAAVDLHHDASAEYVLSIAQVFEVYVLTGAIPTASQ